MVKYKISICFVKSTKGCKSSFKYQNNLITHRKLHLSKHEAAVSDTDGASLQKSQPQPAARKNIYQEFKPIIQLNSDEESTNNTAYIDISNCELAPLNHQQQRIEPNEYKCSYCLYKFNCQEVLNSHLKSHFDGNYQELDILLLRQRIS